MSSFQDILKRQMEIGDKFGGGSNNSGFITKIKIETGFYAYPGKGRDRLLYWKSIPVDATNEQVEAARLEILGRIESAEQPEDFGQYGKFDYCMRVWCDANVLGRDAMSFDQNDFYPRWKWVKDKDGVETEASLIIKNIDEGNLPFGQEFYGRYVLEPRPWHKAQGEEGKTKMRTITKDDGSKEEVKVWPVFALPVEKFATKEEAEKAAGGSTQPSANSNSQWSATAQSNYAENMASLAESADEVAAQYTKILGGSPFNDDATNYPLPTPLTPPNVKKQLAELYSIETSDVDVMLSMNNPI